MDRRFSLFFGMFFSFFAIVASAQKEKDSKSEMEGFKEQKAKYWDNWFVSGGVAGNVLLGEQDDMFTSWKQRLKYGAEFSAGKWFTPGFGMRFHIIGGTLRGYNLAATNGGGGSYTDNSSDMRFWMPMGYGGDNPRRDHAHVPDFDKDGVNKGYLDISYWTRFQTKGLLDPNISHGNVIGFWQEFNYMSANVDIMFNLTHLMRGFYKESIFDLIGYVGGGYIRAFDNKLTTPSYGGVAAKVGLRFVFNLNSNLAIYVDPQIYYIPDPEFDGYVGTAPGDAIFNTGVGLQYTFNRDYTVPSVSAAFLSMDEINYLNEKINNNRAMLEKHQGVLERQQDLLDRLNQCCEEEGGPAKVEREVITQVVTSNYLPEYIRFALNSTQIQFSEEYKFKEASEFLNANPSSKLLLVGYADKKTGTSSYNYELSRRRVEAVSEELIRRGIDPDRLILEWKGDKEQPYAPNDWNRVVIMVER